MPQSTKLRTDDFVLADFRGCEVNRDIQARNKILLHPQFRNVEGMPHILGMHEQMNFAIHRNRHLRGYDVVFGILVVRGIKSEEVCVGLADLLRVKRPKLSIRPRISEVKRKLPGLHLNRQRVRRGRSEIHAGPRLYAKHTQSQTLGADQQKSSYHHSCGTSEKIL